MPSTGCCILKIAPSTPMRATTAIRAEARRGIGAAAGAAKRQLKRVAEITSFVNRFRASATKSRQAQSRSRCWSAWSARSAHVDSPFEFEFAAPLKTPRLLLTIEDAACGYGIPGP